MKSLRRAYLFATLEDDQLQLVEAMSQALRLANGETLFDAGDRAERFYLVQQGQVKLYRLSQDGAEKVIELIRPGHTFAEALMFMARPSYPVYATAVGDVELLAFDNQAFLALLRDSTETCFRLMGDMAMRLHHLIKEIDDLSLQSAAGRVASYLCSKLMESDTTDSVFELDAPKGVIASRLSVKPETFARILRHFIDQGLIRVSSAQIEVLDLARLQAESGRYDS